MDIAFQILMPGYNYDLGHAGKGPSDGWFFFTSYNSEGAYTKLEVNASQNDKDYVAAVNYKKAEQCVASGKAKTVPAAYDRRLGQASREGFPSHRFCVVGHWFSVIGQRISGDFHWLPKFT
jgi:nitrous oxide reductase